MSAALRTRVAAQPNPQGRWEKLDAATPLDWSKAWVTFSPEMNEIQIQGTLDFLSVATGAMSNEGMTCKDCGGAMSRSGSCYTCQTCGSTSGCS